MTRPSKTAKGEISAPRTAGPSSGIWDLALTAVSIGPVWSRHWGPWALPPAFWRRRLRPEAPSLWPALERRTAARNACHRPRWRRAVHGVTERGLRAWAAFDSERPLQFAWLRDSLGEALNGAGLGEPTARGREARRRWVRRPAWVMGTSVAAALLALAIGLPAANRQSGSAQSIINANAQPLPGADVVSRPFEAETPAIANSDDDPGIPPSELAQTDPIPVPETSVPDACAGHPRPRPHPCRQLQRRPRPRPRPSPSRWNYDLEHGTPMPPHARDAKPVY